MCPSTWSNDPSCGANTSAKEHGAAHHACGTNCTNAHAHKAGACAWIPSNCPGAAGGATSQARTDGPKQQRGHASFPGANASTAFPESFCMDKPSSWRDVFPGSQWQATSRAAENSVHDCTPASCSGIDDTGTGLMAARFGAGKQESDLLENLGKKYQQNPDAQVQLISLGSYCGPKLSFQKMGRGAATLPFDWIRTRMEGIIHFLRNDFEGFFDFVTQQRVPDTGLMVMFRGYYHSFWHDDPSDPSMHDRYNRRIARLGEMSSDLGTQLLFVRSNVSHEEVLQVPELMKLLRAKFGKSSRLLLILENQQKFVGPALVDDDDHVMLHYLSMDVHKKSHPDNAMPYARPVECALDWCAEKVTCRHFSTFAEAFQLADPYPGGERGLGGLPAFEATKVLATVEATGQKAVNRADLLETSRNPFDYEADKADKAEGMVLDAKMREPRTRA
ncbi:unnamed protein product [Cladocopium goreaui]|uniref:Uncharacterized protein R408 n=1 Tax=Cladocopium goreaui TaxID=2562237 RepID=A0A9P1GJH3_9DINO|nr:unnamed protein product [Cladocopium goreaui]